MLLAIGLSALLWIAGARTESAPPADIVTMSGIESSLLTDDSRHPRDSEQQWRPQHHTVVAVPDSVWKSAPMHAALAAARSARTFDSARADSSPAPPARSAPLHLRHTPLLI
jgi:hypothetical protein